MHKTYFPNTRILFYRQWNTILKTEEFCHTRDVRFTVVSLSTLTCGVFQTTLIRFLEHSVTEYDKISIINVRNYDLE